MLRKLIALAGCCVVACSGATDSNSVAPWSGPPVDFYGVWESDVVSDETGPVTHLGISLNFINDYGPSSPPSLDVGMFGVAGLCQVSAEDAPIDAIETSDKHGFDGTWKPHRGDSAPAEIHGQVDSTGAMHVQIRVFNGFTATPKGVSTPCSPTWTFIAHHK